MSVPGPMPSVATSTLSPSQGVSGLLAAIAKVSRLTQTGTRDPYRTPAADLAEYYEGDERPEGAHALSQIRMRVSARNDLQLRIQQTTVRVSRPLGWGRARLARRAAAKHGGQPADGSILAPIRRGDKGEPAAVLRARVSTLPTAARCPSAVVNRVWSPRIASRIKRS